MRLESENHNGVCTHCQTSVPAEAIVCTGCGARWGFSNGLNRQQLYDKFKLQYFYGLFTVSFSILALLFVFLIGSGDSFNNLAIGLSAFVVIIFTGSAFITGWQQTTLAKKGKLDWWRAH